MMHCCDRCGQTTEHIPDSHARDLSSAVAVGVPVYCVAQHTTHMASAATECLLCNRAIAQPCIHAKQQVIASSFTVGNVRNTATDLAVYSTGTAPPG